MVRRSKKALALRRKQQEASGQRTNWSREEKLELIAWLDHSVTHKTIDFDETIIGHLKRACGSDYNLKQARGKLKALWDSIGQYGYLNQKCWEDLFDYGSEILILNQEELEIIALARRRIEEHATTTLLETPRRTRGNSRPGDCRLSPLFSLETIVNPKRQQSSQRTQDGTAPSSAVGGIKRSARHGQRKLLRPKRKKKASLFSLSIANSQPMARENVSSSEESHIKSDICAIDGQIMVGGIGADSAHEKREQAELGQNTPVELDEVQDSVEDDDKMITTSLLFDSGSDSDVSIEADSLDQANSDFKKRIGLANSSGKAYQERIDKAIDEIKSLQQKLVHQHSILEAHKKNKIELENKISTMREAQIERDRNSGIGFEATIEQKNSYIREKHRELNDRRVLGYFTKLPIDSKAIFGETSIEKVLKDIYVESRNILYRSGNQKPFLASSTIVADQTDPHLLFKRAFGTDSLTGGDTNRILSKLSSQEIVRLLTMSALCEWVFEADFPQFAQPDSELFQHYRESIRRMGEDKSPFNSLLVEKAKQYSDGALALRNLDLAAHSSIIKSDDFRMHRIPKFAKELAKRLSRVLAPIFNTGSIIDIESDLYGFPTWNQERDDYETRLTRLRTIFERALIAKADSLLNLEVCELVLYSPGTKFSDHTMVAEKGGVIEQFYDNSDDRVVEVCIEAAVFSYPKRILGSDRPNFITEALIQSRNVCHVGDVQREGGTLLVPARVILRDK